MGLTFAMYVLRALLVRISRNGSIWLKAHPAGSGLVIDEMVTRSPLLLHARIAMARIDP